jgi:hypothetical protein
MQINRKSGRRLMVMMAATIALVVISTRVQTDTGTCGGVTITVPFNDVMGNLFFCQIAEAYFSGLTNGTTATTYSPNDMVPRQQMAAFITRTMDQSLRRGSTRAALDQWWTPKSAVALGVTGVGSGPRLVKSDGRDLWVANSTSDTVSRIRNGDGASLGFWTGAQSAFGVLVAAGKVFVTGSTTPGRLYQIDPAQAPGAVTTLSSSLGGGAEGIALDGLKIWTANALGSVSIITLSPFSVSLVAQGFNLPVGIIYDGANIWVPDEGDNKLKKLDSAGAILQSIDVGADPRFPAFDGTNIWVPCLSSNTTSVVRVKDSQGNPLANPFVVATLDGNGMNGPFAAAFDGERVLITNSSGDSVSLWKATDLTPLGSFSTGSLTFPFGVCSNGPNFWLTLGTGNLARF